MALTVITANRLREGDVVYLARDGGWTTRLTDSHAVDTEKDEARLLAVAEGAVAEQRIVGPYAMAVERGGDGLRPIGRRETIRAQRGPSPLSDTEYRTSRGVDADVPV